MTKVIKKTNLKSKKIINNKLPEKSFLKKRFYFGRVTFTDKALFVKHLSVMLNSGLTLVEALNIAEKEARGSLQGILSKIRKDVESGSSLSAAMSIYRKIFPASLIFIIKAGEESGTLGDNLANMAEQMRKENELLGKVRGAMVYPSVVLVASFMLGFAFSFFVLPQITPLFQSLDIELPLSTRIVIAVSSFMRANGIIFIISVIFGTVLLIRFLKISAVKPLSHWFLIKIPVVKKIVKNSNLSRSTRMLGAMINSGLTLDESIEILYTASDNFYYKQAFITLSNEIKTGRKMSEILEKTPNLFPVLFISMIGIGEESGRLGEIFDYLADYYETEVDKSVKALSTALEPILLIIIGFVVALMAIAIIRPIYDITGNIS